VIVSLFWKEYREHRSVWIAMALLAVISLAVAAEALLPQGIKGASEDNVASLVGGALILTAMYGLVCGAMMLAGERESRGMGFLEALPLSRAELWWSKCLFGLIFVLLYSAVVIATGVAVGVVGPDGIAPPWAVVVPLVGVETFAMGLCASTYCRTVLTAVGFAALLPLPILWLFSGMCLASSPANMAGFLPFVLFAHGAATLGALGLSLGTFVDRDFEKRFALKPASTSYGTVAPKRQPRRFEVVLWLALRQGGVLVPILLVLGFLLGLALPAAGAGLWPAGTLLSGVACGTAVFMGEQSEGAFKFWGDQRLPVGWLWLRRSGLWAGVATATGALMLLGSLIHVASQGGLSADPADLFDKLLGGPPALGAGGALAFVVIWPAYGFALGQLCALVWRKSAVAVVVAVMTSAGVVCLWVPSLLGGGLYLLQALGVPLLLLAGCRLALWDWVTDRLRTRPSVVRLVGAVALAWAWLVAGFAFRAVEAPGGAEPFDPAALATLKARAGNPEEGRAAQKIRGAFTAMKEREAVAAAPVGGGRPPGGPGFPGPAGGPGFPGPGFPGPGFRPAPPLHRDQVGRVIEQGWAAATPEFDKWLDLAAADPWPAQLADAVRMAPGVFIAPTTSEDGGKGDRDDCHSAAELLTAHALQVQARGQDEAALEHLVTVLTLSRHLRHQTPGYAYLEGVEEERLALVGLDHWLSRLGAQPKLLHKAREALKEHEAAVPPVSEALAADYLRFCDGLGTRSRAGSAGFEGESLLMQTPWEAARARRLTDAVFAGRRRMAESGDVVPQTGDALFDDWLSESGGAGRERLERLLASSWLGGTFPATAPVQRAAQLGLCRARAARVQVALALYQAEHGKAAASLDDLGPGLPDDPFSRQPFRYRVSQGERVTWPRRLAGGGVEAVREVPAGWGILWSVGPDGGDDGGVRQWDASAAGAGGHDLIFLVPAGKG
jgi:ABC-type transport system involved in multi-copper enzyme maturation permease subunit